MTAEIPQTKSHVTGYAPVNNTKIFYDLRGAGHPLVLIHAGIADSRMWDLQIDSLAEHYRFLWYDAGKFS